MSSLIITAAGFAVFVATVAVQLTVGWWRSGSGDKPEGEDG